MVRVSVSLETSGRVESTSKATSTTERIASSHAGLCSASSAWVHRRVAASLPQAHRVAASGA